ncbi:VWFA and cache domain-containing protein 1-like [Styela clava]
MRGFWHFQVLAVTLILSNDICNIKATSEPVGPANTAQPGDFLEETVRNFLTNTAGLEEFQEIIDSSEFAYTRLDSENLVHEMVASLTEKFRNTASAVERLRTAATQAYSYGQWIYDVTECCQLEIMNGSWSPKYDQRFGREVDLFQACARISGDRYAEARLYETMRRSPSSLIASSMESLYSTSGIKYQYYGSEEGMFTQYPAASTGFDCTSYDNRFRPWYVVAATPQPKDVVIVIDTSGSMLMENRMEGAKAAVATVLETLNPNDRVAVIAFSSNIILPPGPPHCYQEEMALATPANTKYLRQWVGGLYAMGGTHFISPLNAAFDYFETTYEDTSDYSEISRNQVILFMSDGEPNDNKTDIFWTIYNRNAKFHHSIVIMTYAFGAQAPGEVLEKMSRQDGTDYGVPRASAAREGLHVAITDTDNLRTKMGSYYNFFKSESINTHVHWSVPYYDAIGGAGLVITASAAVVYDGTLKGVVGADISMRELLTEITYFKVNSDMGYSFLVDKNFRAIAHPFLPAPSSVDGDPVMVNITMLERSPALKDGLLPAIMNLYNHDSIHDMAATMEIRTMFVKEAEHGLVSAESKLARFSCQLVTDSPFAACVVVDTVRNTQSTLEEQEVSDSPSFQYHRLDLDPPENECLHLSRIAYHGSAVKLSPKAFKHMESYLEFEETANNVTSYKNMIENDFYDEEGLQIEQAAVNDVRLTSRMDEIWKNNNIFNASIPALWRYLGTESGVFRIWPGVRLAQEYDPTLRPWYKTAMAHRDDLAITTPYTDASTGMWIITMTKAVMVDEGHPYGVIASDVFLSDFKDMFLGYECGREDCTLIDLSCHVIYHKSYSWSHGSSDILGRDLTTVDPNLASVVFDQRLLVTESCIDVNKIRTEHSCRVNLEKLDQLSEIDFEGKEFFARRIHGTNTVLIINHWDSHYYCTKHASVDEHCHYDDNSEYCESACHTSAKFDYCSNSESYDWALDPPPCVASKPKVSVLPPVDALTDLPSCYDALASWETESNDGLWDDYPVDYNEKKPHSNSFGLIFGLSTAVTLVFVSCVMYVSRSKNRSVSPQQTQHQQPHFQTTPNQQPIIHPTTTMTQNPNQFAAPFSQQPGSPNPYVQVNMTNQFSVPPGTIQNQHQPPPIAPPSYNNAMTFDSGIPPPPIYIPPTPIINPSDLPPAPRYM